jgi:hypothetical protein
LNTIQESMGLTSTDLAAVIKLSTEQRQFLLRIMRNGEPVTPTSQISVPELLCLLLADLLKASGVEFDRYANIVLLTLPSAVKYIELLFNFARQGIVSKACMPTMFVTLTDNMYLTLLIRDPAGAGDITCIKTMSLPDGTILNEKKLQPPLISWSFAMTSIFLKLCSGRDWFESVCPTDTVYMTLKKLTMELFKIPE